LYFSKTINRIVSFAEDRIEEYAIDGHGQLIGTDVREDELTSYCSISNRNQVLLQHKSVWCPNNDEIIAKYTMQY
jgi:hypothetical protein